MSIDYCTYCKKEIKGSPIGSEYTRDWLGRVYHGYCMHIAEQENPYLVSDRKIYNQWLRHGRFVDGKWVKWDIILPERILEQVRAREEELKWH